MDWRQRDVTMVLEYNVSVHRRSGELNAKEVFGLELFGIDTDRTSTNQGRIESEPSMSQGHIDSKTRLELESVLKSKSKAMIARKESRQPHWIPAVSPFERGV